MQIWGALGAFSCILGASLQVAYAAHTPDPDKMPEQPPDFKYVNMWYVVHIRHVQVQEHLRDKVLACRLILDNMSDTHFRELTAGNGKRFLPYGSESCRSAKVPPVALALANPFKNQSGPVGNVSSGHRTSKDGETHISECEMKGFILKSFASKGAPQYVRQNDLKVVKTSFTQVLPAVHTSRCSL